MADFLTSADEVPAESVPEVVEHAVPVLLGGEIEMVYLDSRAWEDSSRTALTRSGQADLSHLGVDVETRVAQLGDLLG